ncbi:helix-turn-helix domain-containing protein [Massilia sp. NR 4-1]|uniref:helix-turn-helix domain-containing protein n=1 Tax=Massilia sp. NR 4-1 TaxID=1678028 RepID=UPI0009E2A5F5|nr:helix-turn-helix domain-containing protein [Massilia sp. NR 4-1]
MDVSNSPKKSAQANWHRADIVAALHKNGWSLRQLSHQSGLGYRTVNSALDRPYPNAERIIAAAIGIAPEIIWPERYAKRNFTPVLPLTTAQSSQSSQSLQHAAA